MFENVIFFSSPKLGLLKCGGPLIMAHANFRSSFQIGTFEQWKMVLIMFVWNQLVNLKLESYQSKAKEHQGHKKYSWPQSWISKTRQGRKNLNLAPSVTKLCLFVYGGSFVILIQISVIFPTSPSVLNLVASFSSFCFQCFCFLRWKRHFFWVSFIHAPRDLLEIFEIFSKTPFFKVVVIFFGYFCVCRLAQHFYVLTTQ